jgi:general secretion pathway protein K
VNTKPAQYPQTGAALLMAMLTVALVATLASAALWQQWRTLSVESAEREAQQTAWLLRGAQDWALVVLKEDGRGGNTDHFAEPWSVPLREARLSAFLAAGSNGEVNNSETLSERVFLSGRITDMQSRLNVNNLLEGNKLNERGLLTFTRLYRVLGLPESELRQWTSALLASVQNPPLANAPLPPQRLEQLRWLGISASSLARLAPHISVLPVHTPVNLNTASVQVLYASVPELDLVHARQWVTAREQKPFDNVEDIRTRMGTFAENISPDHHSVNTRFFEVTGQLRQGTIYQLQKSLVQRDGNTVKTLWREQRPLRAEPGCLSTIPAPC